MEMKRVALQEGDTQTLPQTTLAQPLPLPGSKVREAGWILCLLVGMRVNLSTASHSGRKFSLHYAREESSQRHAYEINHRQASKFPSSVEGGWTFQKIMLCALQT